jgi:hypothetical protein
MSYRIEYMHMNNSSLLSEILDKLVAKQCLLKEYQVEGIENIMPSDHIPDETYLNSIKYLDIIKRRINYCNKVKILKHNWHLLARLTSNPADLSLDNNQVFQENFNSIRYAFKWLNVAYLDGWYEFPMEEFFERELKICQDAVYSSQDTLFKHWDNLSKENISHFKAMHIDLVKFRDRNFLEEYYRFMEGTGPLMVHEGSTEY